MRPHSAKHRKAYMERAPEDAGFGPDGFFAGLNPGQRVRHPSQPDWGCGQVQSVAGSRVTVNFENAGKVLINARVITLDVLGDE